MILLRRQNARLRGFTIPELLLFVVVVGIALTGVLTVLDLDVARGADPVRRKQAIAIAEAFVEEIMVREFSAPGGFTGTSTQANRYAFVDVDDYNGFSSNGVYTLGDATTPGTLIAGLENYAVSIAVAVTTTATGPAGQQVSAGNMKTIKVSVTAPGGETVSVLAYMANI